MKTTVMHMPRPADVIGDTINDYPNGWDWPYTSLIREFWRPNHPEVLGHPNETYQITIPRYAVLTMKDRNYRLEFTKEYAAKKGYAPVIEGNWG